MKKRPGQLKPNQAVTRSRSIRFDYKKAKPNRFASRTAAHAVVVKLEPDVAEVFTKSETVNRVLRALIRTMPSTSGRKAHT